MKETDEGWSDYFRYRNIATCKYADYRLPVAIRKALPAEPNSRILDIGCGLGQFLHALGSIGYRETEGIDISPEAVENCLRRGLNVSRIENLERYCEEYSGPRFDLILMSHVLEHIRKDRIIPTLRLIRDRLLATGGGLLVMVPNAQSNTGCYWAYEDFTHGTLFTAGSLYFVLMSAGFGEVRFLDPDGVEDSKPLVRLGKRILLPIYRMRLTFWNLVTSSSFHRESPQIFTYELKALAR